jgi:hypothetical protein
MYRNTQTQYKQTCTCTQMFALCGNRTRDLLRSRRVFPPLHHIGHPVTHIGSNLIKEALIMLYFFNGINNYKIPIEGECLKVRKLTTA